MYLLALRKVTLVLMVLWLLSSIYTLNRFSVIFINWSFFVLTLQAMYIKSMQFSKWRKTKVHACCCVWFFATPWTVAHQAPLSIGFLPCHRQEDWSGLLPFSPLGDLLNPGIVPASPALTGGFFNWATWESLPSDVLKNIWNIYFPTSCSLVN